MGDAGVRANAQQDKIFVGMILILIFGEALALYGLIVSLILTSQGWKQKATKIVDWSINLSFYLLLEENMLVIDFNSAKDMLKERQLTYLKLLSRHKHRLCKDASVKNH